MAVSSFAQVTGTFWIDQSVLIGNYVGSGFVGLSHDNFQPDMSFSLPAYSFLGYCTDLEIPAYWNTNYYEFTQVTTAGFYQLNQAGNVNQQLGSEISWIADYTGFTSNANVATAGQLAIWEIQGLSLTDVESHLGANFTPGQASTAAGYVSDAETAYANGVRSVSPWFESPYTNGSQVTQDFVEPVATPEPRSEMVLGLALVGLFLRRRAR